jgi:hypothetical protein
MICSRCHAVLDEKFFKDHNGRVVDPCNICKFNLVMKTKKVYFELLDYE